MVRWTNAQTTTATLRGLPPPTAYNDATDNSSKYEDGNDAVDVVRQRQRQQLSVNKTTQLLFRRENRRDDVASWKATSSSSSIPTQRSNFNNNFDLLAQQQQQFGPSNQDEDNDDNNYDSNLKTVDDYTANNNIDKNNNIPADYYYYHNDNDGVDANQPPLPRRNRQRNSARDNVDDSALSSPIYDSNTNVWPFDTRQTRPPSRPIAPPPTSAFITTNDPATDTDNIDGDQTLWFDVVPNTFFHRQNASMDLTMYSSRNSSTTTTALSVAQSSENDSSLAVFSSNIDTNYGGMNYSGGAAASTLAVFYQHNQNNSNSNVHRHADDNNAYFTPPPPPAPSFPSSVWPSQQQLPSLLSPSPFSSDATSASSLSSSSSSFQALTLLYGIPMILIAIGTIFGNILICAAVGNSRHLRKSITNYFVVSLAIADLLLGICVLPVSATRSILGYFPFGPLFCNLYVGTDVFLSTASILNLFMVSIDRYFAITTPLRYYDVVTRSRAHLALTFVWLSSALTGYLPIYLGWNTDNGVTQNTATKYVAGECAFPVENAWYSFSIGLGTFFVPLAVLYVMYSHILRISYGHVRAIKKQIAMMAQFQVCTSKMSASAPPSTSSNHHIKSSSNMNLSTAGTGNKGNNYHSTNNHSNNTSSVTNNTLRQHRATLTLFIIVGAFSLCWIPYFVCFTIRPLDIAFFRPSVIVDDIFLWMGYLNSFVNPFIYGMTNREYRHAFKSMLRVMWSQVAKVFCCMCNYSRRKKHQQPSSGQKSGMNNSYDFNYNTSNVVPRGRAAAVHSTSNQSLNNNSVMLKSCLKSKNVKAIPSFQRQPSNVPSRSGSHIAVMPSIKMEPSRSFPHRYANSGLRPELDHGSLSSRRSADMSSSARDILLDNLIKESVVVNDEPPSSVPAVIVPRLKKSPSSNSYYDNVVEGGVVRPRMVTPNDRNTMPTSVTAVKNDETKVVTLNRRKNHSSNNGHVKNYEMYTGKVSLLSDNAVKHRFPVELADDDREAAVPLTKPNGCTNKDEKQPRDVISPSASYGTRV